MEAPIMPIPSGTTPGQAQTTPARSSSSKRRFHIPGYFYAAALTSIGGFLNGYDTGCIGAVTDMKQFADTFGHLSPFMRGWTVSLLMLCGTFPAFFAGQLADKWGRLHVVSLGVAIFTVGATLEAAAGGGMLAMFLVGRALCGFGEGIWLGNVVVYISEIAPASNRGVLVSLPQMYTATGVCLGYFTCYGSVNVEFSIAWRLPFVVMAIFGLVLTAGCQLLPESPRWLLSKGLRDRAEREIEKLDIPRAEAEKDYLQSTQVNPSMGFWDSLALIFRRPYRKMTVLALVMLGGMQLSGIDGVLYYAPTLFAQSGLPSQQASFLASGVSAILMLAITIPAFLLADRWSRRTAIISGGLLLTGCMLLIGSLYAANIVTPTGIARWVVVVSIFVFALTYCFTWAVVGKIYACEIQPMNTRAAANAAAQGLGFFTNWLVAITTPIFLANSSFGAYFLYGGLSLSVVVFSWAQMPETRGRSLEAIQEGFKRPVMSSLTHHVRRWFSHNRSSDTSSDRSSVELELQDALNTLTPPAQTAGNSSASSMRGGILSFESVTAV